MNGPNWPERWQPAYQLLKDSIIESQLNTWVKPLAIFEETSSNEGLKIHFHAPNEFVADWARDHFKTQIESAFSQVVGANCRIHFSVDPNQGDGALNPAQNIETTTSFESLETSNFERASDPFTSTAATHISSSAPVTESALNPQYTFDHFIVGASNQFAHASAVAVAEQPGRHYNPLFIYSQPGLGKTHLLHAIGHHVRSKNPRARVTYLSAERFVNDMIDSIQKNRMSQFRTKYRDNCDVLLIDDIQFIAGKARTEEEFFHTFNALHSSRRQIVVTSDRPPREIEGLEERVRTRFESGLITDIQPPEIETRIAILKAKAERDDIYLPDEVATFLATYIKSNMRELEGVLVRIQAQCSLTGAEISLEMGKQLLKNLVPEEGTHFTAESILQAVSKAFSLKVQDLRSKSKARTVAFPRQIAMFLIRKYTGMGLKEIGHYFGGKDHTTVLHACSKIESGIDTDEDIRTKVEAIQNQL